MCDDDSHVDLTAEMIMNESRWICLFLYLTIVWTSVIARGIIRCDCTTQACVDAGKSMCVAREACYTELYQNVITRGCDPSGLACENRRPAGLNVEWPTLYCCRNKDLCNKHVIPTIASTPEPKLGKEQPHPDIAIEKEPHEKHNPSGSADRADCTSTSSKSSAKSGPESQSRSKVINPIYIAVPVAGVCVLLALIIFAMYLLRRRTDYHHQHDNYHHHYHPEHLPALSHSHKQAVQHHCQCTCKKQTLPPCSKGNRCTESERSSSGSETKLFLQT